MPGIIDPTKVIRIALENAISVSSVLLLTEATLTEALIKARTRAVLSIKCLLDTSRESRKKWKTKKWKTLRMQL